MSGWSKDFFLGHIWFDTSSIQSAGFHRRHHVCTLETQRRLGSGCYLHRFWSKIRINIHFALRPEDVVRKKLGFWINKGVLIEIDGRYMSRELAGASGGISRLVWLSILVNRYRNVEKDLEPQGFD